MSTKVSGSRCLLSMPSHTAPSTSHNQAVTCASAAPAGSPATLTCAPQRRGEARLGAGNSQRARAGTLQRRGATPRSHRTRVRNALVFFSRYQGGERAIYYCCCYPHIQKGGKP
eukprot:6032907-Pyramimonas_sp.AAC.1